MARERFGELEAALDSLQRRALELAQTASRRPLDAKIRRFEPVQQVAARLELAGPERLVPRVRAGVDIRGDGSAEVFMGRVRRRLIEPRRGEDIYAALAREVRSRLDA